MTTPNASVGVLERLFKLSENKTNFRTEVLAGVTTFLTMCYIIIVNPLILSETGMDHGAVFVATCLAAAIVKLLYYSYRIRKKLEITHRLSQSTILYAYV